MKKLSQYAKCLSDLGFTVKNPTQDCDIEYISYSSKDVKPHTLFICKGQGFKAEYLKNAIKDGVCAYVSEIEYDVDIPCILVKDALFSMSAISAFHFDYPQNQLKLISITGTKGKSTSSFFLKGIIDNYLQQIDQTKCAIISTIWTYDGIESFESHMTTPEGIDLYRHLANAVKSGIKYCIVESSSQAFKYGRLFGLTFDAGIFLNISQDHISPIEHCDFEDYFTSKLKIFDQCRMCGINTQSDMQDRLFAKAKESPSKIVTFGFDEDDDLYGYNIENTGENLKFMCKTKDFNEEFQLSIAGKFNIENALGAISCALELGIPLKNIKDGLARAKVDGRMEVFHSLDNSKIVIVDFAHNLLSMTKLFEAVKEEYPGRQITTVFGCPGGKAKNRRRELGMISGIHSDRIYLTEDDCDFENIRDISMEIFEYASRNCDDIFFVDDRVEAIGKGIFESSDNSVILLVAKGRETRLKRKGKYVDSISDADSAQNFLSLYDSNVKVKI